MLEGHKSHDHNTRIWGHGFSDKKKLTDRKRQNFAIRDNESFSFDCFSVEFQTGIVHSKILTRLIFGNNLVSKLKR